MSKETLSHQRKEIPRNEKLALETISIVAKAVCETYPSLTKRYSKRAIFEVDINTVQEITEMTNANIPTQKTKMETTLQKAGLLKTSILDQRKEDFDPIYLNNDAENKAHAIENFFFDFISDNPKKRIDAAITFGLLYIHKTIESLPIPRELEGKEKLDWKEIATSEIHNLTEELKTKDIVDPGKLDRLRFVTKNTVLNSPDARYFAYGGEVRIVLPEQNIIYPSYIAGEILNRGIVEKLTIAAQLEFMKKIERRYGLIMKKTETIETPARKLAEETLKNIKFVEGTLFHAYILSQIPGIISSLRQKKTPPTLA